ncbi:hypothetical protein TNCV_952931 [Trichonephila clavipes]|nr:hypothetical protein TNCV_952931 [Trichonephila clavipes]
MLRDVSRTGNNGGCGSPVVRVSDYGRYVMSSSSVPLKTHRVGQRCTLNLSRAETSSRWCGGHHLQSSSLQHSHTSTFGAAIADNSPGSKFSEVPFGDFLFLPEPLPLRPRTAVPNSVYVTLRPEVHEQMYRSDGRSDGKPQCQVPKRAWYSFIDPMKG